MNHKCEVCEAANSTVRLVNAISKPISLSGRGRSSYFTCDKCYEANILSAWELSVINEYVLRFPDMKIRYRHYIEASEAFHRMSKKIKTIPKPQLKLNLNHVEFTEVEGEKVWEEETLFVRKEDLSVEFPDGVFSFNPPSGAEIELWHLDIPIYLSFPQEFDFMLGELPDNVAFGGCHREKGVSYFAFLVTRASRGEVITLTFTNSINVEVKLVCMS